MTIAEEILQKYDELFNNLPGKGRGNLRFGLALVAFTKLPLEERKLCVSKAMTILYLLIIQRLV